MSSSTFLQRTILSIGRKVFAALNDQTKGWITNEWVLELPMAAVRWHVRQWRKGSAEEPYINHLLEVANLVTATMQDGSKLVSLIDQLIVALREGGIEKSTFGEDIQSTNLAKS